MPVISVIVPVYKVEAFLHRCVDSILSQSFRDFDLILVDDGSPDNCGRICEEYARGDERIHVIHQKNGGLSAARNTGIEWALANSGSGWLAFVDSDDWIHPDFLQRLYDGAAQTGCRVSACDYFCTEGDDFPAREPKPFQVMSADDYYCGGKIGDGMTAVAWNKLYDKQLFRKLRYPVGKLHEDEFTTFRAVYEAGSICVIREPLYAYFQNSAGIMKSSWTPRKLDILEALEARIAFARENGNERLLEKTASQYVYSTSVQIGFVEKWRGRGKRKYLKSLRRELRQALRQEKEQGLFPLSWKYSWVYEEAYPIKPFWWLYWKLRGKGE